MRERPKIKVYSGLSLQAHEVQAILPGALFAPPVQREDVARDLATGVGVIVIVDGKFMQSFAVSPGELMDALRSGVRIYGCSSMGAMRATELQAHGMIGHGAIFEHIRDCGVFDDDLLSQSYSEEPLRALGVAYMDLHFALRSLERRGKLNRLMADRILRVTAKLSFPERDLPRISERLRKVYKTHAGEMIALLSQALRAPRQKKLDAIETLHRMRRELAEVAAANQVLSSRC